MIGTFCILTLIGLNVWNKGIIDLKENWLLYTIAIFSTIGCFFV